MKRLWLFRFGFHTILLAIMSIANGQNVSTIDSLIYKYELSRNDSVRVKTLIEISNQYSSIDLPLSFQYAEKALGLAEQTGNRLLYAQALLTIGSNCFYQGLNDESVKYFYKALEVNREIGNNQGIINSLTNLGGVLLQLLKFDESKNYFLQALDVSLDFASERGDSLPLYQVVSIYNNLGIVHENLNEYNQAVDYYKRGIVIAKKMPNQQKNLAMLHNNLGSLYMKNFKYNDALDNMEQALLIRRSISDKNGEAASYRMLGILYKNQNNISKAIENFYKGYALANEVGSTPILSSISEQLFEIYNSSNLPDSALKYHILVKNYSDILKTEETLRELTKMELHTQFQEKEKLQMIEQRRKTLWYYFIAITLSLIVIILSLLYILSQSRLRRLSLINTNIQLASENAVLERETLSKELEIKNKELTTNVIYQIRKNELISSIAEKLLANSHNFRKENQQLIKEIIEDLENTQEDSIWMEFETRFHQVHNQFYEKLNAINPDLSPNERRLCAFLRLNMSTKEISSITGQSLRSIEVARTRLRKKLNLTNSELGLIEHLSSL
jgi:tetratricopeptide (TPR) repeat protein